MSYTGSTISSSTPAVDLMSAFKTQIDGHAGWEFVETVTSGTRVTDVFKCLGTTNSWEVDFFIYVARASDTGSVGVGISETYDSVAKTAGSIAPYVTTTTSIAIDANGRYATSRHVCDETTLVSSTVGFMAMAGSNTATTLNGGVNVNTTGFSYWISVTADRVVFWTSVASLTPSGAYAGLFDSFHAIGVDPAPLIVANLYTGGSSALSSVSVTMSPGVTAGTVANPFGLGQVLYTNIDLNSTVTISKEFISQKWWASRIMICQPNTTATVHKGAMRGLLKSDLLVLSMEEVVEASGDTVTIDGTTYTCINVGAANTSTGSLWVSQSA